MTTAAPADLDLNTPHRFYRGGERILAFRRLPVPEGFDGHRPEDWLASTTRLFAEGGDGITTLGAGSDRTDLPAALATDPTGWFGPAHLAAHGPTPNLLTKLLDAGERLPVHTHPDRAFAAAHLDCDNGKTEAWIVLDAEPGAQVWLGFREDLDADVLEELVVAQDERLLAALNPVPVERGDAFLVPAGTPHAIGEGVFVLELQEPTDLSVMLENVRFGLDPAHAFLGLDRPLALASVNRRALGPEGLAALHTRWLTGPGTHLALVEKSTDFFVAEVLRATATTPVEGPSAFAVTVVVEGQGLLTAGDWSQEVATGDVLLLPHGAGPVRLEGDVTVIRCMPAVPSDDTPAPTH